MKVRPGSKSELGEAQSWLDQLRGDAGEADMPGHQGPPAWTAGQPAAAPGDRRPPASGMPQPRAAPLTGRAREPGTPPARPVIGDQLRLPMVWCQMGACIARHRDPQALGEADIRARAIAAGWRVDTLGQLACPACQQASPHFWPTHGLVIWHRDAATTAATRLAEASRDGQRPGGRTRPGAAPLAALPAQVPPRDGLRIRGRHHR